MSQIQYDMKINNSLELSKLTKQLREVFCLSLNKYRVYAFVKCISFLFSLLQKLTLVINEIDFVESDKGNMLEAVT
jgi:hypothetical protein